MKNALEKAEIWKSRLGIVALFILFTEAVATVSLKFALDAKSEFVGHLVWFIILYPVFLTLLFFITLWTKHRVLYAPKDFTDEPNFLREYERQSTDDVGDKRRETPPNKANPADS